MVIRDLLALVLSNLRRIKTRVAMTAIGVVIGTAAVVVLVSLGAGLQKQATESLFSMGGLDELIVRDDSYRGGRVAEDGREQERRSDKLDDEKLAEIRQMEGVVAASPFIEVMMQGPLKLDRREGWGQIYGVDMDAFVQFVEVEQGTLDLYRGQVVIGASVPENFVPWEERERSETPPVPPDMMGETLQLTRYSFDEGSMSPTETTVGRMQVVGVLQRHGYMYDYGIFMPLKEAQKLNQQMSEGGAPMTPGSQDRGRYSQIMIKVAHPNLGPAVEQALKDQGFSIQSDRAMLGEINQFFVVVQAILGGIGAVALLVAAFGIANTMTMAIYERTREIGLMKAIGATNQDVMSVFLAEAGGIGFLGGLGGVLLAMGLNATINLLAQTLLPQGGGIFGGPQQGESFSLAYTPLWLPIFAITFATLIGIGSGIYPAIRAAALNPIQALKYE
jgi:putative ABC transport system permease protein